MADENHARRCDDRQIRQEAGTFGRPVRAVERIGIGRKHAAILDVVPIKIQRNDEQAGNQPIAQRALPPNIRTRPHESEVHKAKSGGGSQERRGAAIRPLPVLPIDAMNPPGLQV